MQAYHFAIYKIKQHHKSNASLDYLLETVQNTAAETSLCSMIGIHQWNQ